MISSFSDNCNNLSAKNENILHLDQLKSNNRVKFDINLVKNKFIYRQISQYASTARAKTMALIIKKIQEKAQGDITNSLIYSHKDKVCKDMTFRQVRLSYRETLSRVMQILVSCYEIKTGKLHDNISYKEISREAEVSLSTIKRIMLDLKRKGFIDVVQQRRAGYDGNMYAIDAVKSINPSFFIQVLGRWAWDKVCQYKRTKENKNNTFDANEYQQPISWKESAIVPYNKKTDSEINKDSAVYSLISGLSRSKNNTPFINISLSDTQRRIPKEGYYGSYSKPDYSPRSPSPIVEHIHQHACHKEFVAPTLEQPIEQVRSAGRSAMADIMAKLRGRSPPT